MLRGFLVSLFYGFVVSWFRALPSLDSEVLTGFLVSWFYGFVVFMVSCTSIAGQRDVDRFLGFFVSCTPSLDSEVLTSFLVSWFHALHLWTA